MSNLLDSSCICILGMLQRRLSKSGSCFNRLEHMLIAETEVPIEKWFQDTMPLLAAYVFKTTGRKLRATWRRS